MTNPHDTKGEQPTSFTDPPEPECEYCKGTEVVKVDSVETATGEVLDWACWPGEDPKVPCPWCQG